MLAILTTHPIQYQVPLWQALAHDGRVPFEVWYLTAHGTQASRDREFGATFAWDLDMLSGYPHAFLRTAPGATPNSFWKCRLDESLSRRIEEKGIKALWIQGWQVAAYWQAVWTAHAAGVEVWLRGESNDLRPLPFWKRAVKRVVLGQLFARVDRFLYIGTANRRLYESFGVPAARLYSAPYAVDNERFARQAAEIRDSRFGIRNSWGIPDDSFCILFCGKFIPKKRPMDAVLAVQALQQSRPEMKLHLLFVGSGELSPELREACNAAFDAEGPLVSPSTGRRSLLSASFAGFLNQTEVSRAYVAADCLVLPSDSGETWGLVVNEALASGLPSVVSDACGCAEDVAASVHPRSVYRCGNVHELAEAIVTVASGGLDPAARSAVLERHSLARTAEVVRELSRSLRQPERCPCH